MADYDESRVVLIRLAQQLAEVGTAGVAAGQEDRYLERFRAIYDHLEATVFTATAGGRERRRDSATPSWD